MTLPDLELMNRLKGHPVLEERHCEDIVSDIVPFFDALDPVPDDCPLLAFTFYVQAGNSQSVIRNLSWGAVDPRSEPWATTLTAFAEAFALSNPLATLILVTDTKTPLPEIPGRHRIVRAEFDSNRLMFERQRAFSALLQSRLFAKPVVFLDSDVVVTRDLATVFEQDFDVGLTYRAATNTLYALMPANEGVIFANSANPASAIGFFQAVLNHYRALAEHPDVLKWYPGGIWCWRGGQLALNSVGVGWKLIRDDAGTRFADREGARVAFLPCHRYNRTLRGLDGNGLQELKESYAIHFKGDRKSAIPEAVAQLKEQSFSFNKKVPA